MLHEVSSHQFEVMSAHVTADERTGGFKPRRPGATYVVDHDASLSHERQAPPGTTGWQQMPP
ncbi:hypothetical protein CVCC1112_2079 [Paenarthrobacter nicotinovorans]|nr:hypothetical protein CVCC1112_2079 [Paenarthrobacter nicotinovorans]